MFFWGNKGAITQGDIVKHFKSYTFQRVLAAVITVILAFILVQTGAAPKKYKLFEGMISQYDINAPRDIENSIKTEENAKAAAASVTPVMMEIVAASSEVYKSMDDFITLIEESRRYLSKRIEEAGLNKNSDEYNKKVEIEREAAAVKTYDSVNNMNILLSMEQIRYLVYKSSDEEIYAFSRVAREIITSAMKEDITNDSLFNVVNKLQNDLQTRDINQELKNVGSILIKSILKPNRAVDIETTKKRQEEAYNRKENVVKVLKDERIISSGDIVTKDKFKILAELNLLETTRRFDFAFSAGILIILLLMTVIIILYMNNFCKDILNSRDDVIILCVIIVIILATARWVVIYSPLTIPIFIAAMSISILLDLKLAIIVNFVLTTAIAFMAKGNLNFIYMSIIGGSLAAFMVSGANQRSKLSMTGLVIGGVNSLIIICLGLINKSGVGEIGINALLAFFNGMMSMILTIGLLPFWESTFNVITPLKLLELSNPNQPLLKRLLVEAPGTYHHSLMVGNLAEEATLAIGGDSLLARVGACFHDVGKLARPNFFKENQLSENPHDRITPNLSTLIITSHTSDGVELAKKHKIPLAIRDIISQHHGTTLVAFFYHKAKSGDKGDQVKADCFRYEGPRPSSKEAAVVMLADSVEAAVRSMSDKTEGKIEGLVRKIIKDKLDDGQLNLCNLTLKDLDSIAKAFMRVFSGYFHERQPYPEIKPNGRGNDKISSKGAGSAELPNEQLEERKMENGSVN